MSRSALIRQWLPPALYGPLGRASGRSLRFTGQPANWAEAQAQSGGYDDTAILARVVQATREVIAGRAAFERDGMLFAHLVPPFQLLAPLLRHALAGPGGLDVIDFGGSLGSTYRLCKSFLPPGLPVRWQVIEQPGFVAAGQAEFSTEALSFHAGLDDLPPAASPRLLLASSVLQYLPDPDAQLAAWRQAHIRSLLIDRAPLWQQAHHHLCIQRVPRQIVEASYPMWVLSLPRLLQGLGPDWRPVCEFDCAEGRHPAEGGVHFDFKGLFMERM